MAITKTEYGYKAEVYLGRNPKTGKQIRRYKNFKRMADARIWEAEIIQQYNDGILSIDQDMNISEYLDYWFDNYARVNVSAASQVRYRNLLNIISEELGNIKLDELRTFQVDSFYANLLLEEKEASDGNKIKRYSSGYVLKVHKIFRQALEKAVAWEFIMRNPVQYAEAPKENKTDIKTWTLKQSNQFLDIIEDEIIYYPVLVAINTGLRVGEICALRWEDIDLEEGYLHVNHNAVELKGRGVVLKEPKTDDSKATVAMTEQLIVELKALRIEHKKHKLKTGIDLRFICGWKDGDPLRPTYVSRAFRNLVDDTDLPRITFHGLRHTHASILYELGATSQEISKRLRHSRVSTTDDIYIHLQEDTKKSTADLFNQAVENIK